MSYAHLKFVTHPDDEEDGIPVSRARSAPVASGGATEGAIERSESSPFGSADGCQANDWGSSREGYEMIARAAYFRAQKRGFAAGDDVSNWLEAEKALLKLLKNTRTLTV